MKKHIVKIMMLLAVPALAVVSCDSYDRTEVVPTVTVDYNKVTLFENETVQLTASPKNLTFTWESLNPDIATVDANGLVTAVLEGATSVVAKAGDVSFAVEVIVQTKVAITGVMFRDDDLSILSPGGTRTLIITQIPSGGNDIPMTDFEWWVDDENIARVSQSGVIKGINYGETKVHYRRGPYQLEGIVLVPDQPNRGTLPVFSQRSTASKMVKEWDEGGEGVGYHDTSGAPVVEDSGNIGDCASGEWLAYTIYVKNAGKYKLTMYGSSDAGAGSYGGDYQWYLTEVAEGNELGGHFKQQSGGAWGGPWMPSEAVEVELPAGFQRLIFYMHNGAHNFYNFTAEYVGE